MKRILINAFYGILLGIVAGILVGNMGYEATKEKQEASAILTMANMEETEKQDGETSVQNAVLRFHIRANSDNTEDQKLKMEVKEYALSILQPVMSEASSLEDAKRLISNKLPYVKTAVESFMQQKGYDYEAQVYFTTEYFPIKQYGDVTFPAGEYEAVRIDIGESQGENWWCVMYPTLCFVDATHAVLPLEEKEKLRELLTEEEYEELMQSSKEEQEEKVFLHSKLWDWWKEWVE